MNLDQRLKLTAFVMIQRIDDDEKLERIAKQALDFQSLSQALEKNRKHLQASSGEGTAALEEMFENKMRKDNAAMEDGRHTFD